MSTRERTIVARHEAEALEAALAARLAAGEEEPAWLREQRVAALQQCLRRPMPRWGGDLSELDLASIPLAAGAADDAPGATDLALAARGVVVSGMDEALRAHEPLVRRHFGTVCASGDSKFAALNAALWRGGTFVYVPAGIRVEEPITVTRRPGAARALVARTLIVVEEGAAVTIAESLDAPAAMEDAIHADVMEVVVGAGAHCRVTVAQRWPGAVYHLVTKRALVHAGGVMEWVDAGAGGRVTMTYPSAVLAGAGARAAIRVLALASDGEHHDTGGKLVVEAPDCAGSVAARLVARGGGRTTFRGLVKVARGGTRARCATRHDTLLLGPEASGSSFPYVELDEGDAVVERDASVARGEPAAVLPFVAPVLDALPAAQRALFLDALEHDVR